MKVAARRKGKVRVSAGRLARARTVRFKRRGAKTVRLKLTARGKRTLRACGGCGSSCERGASGRGG